MLSDIDINAKRENIAEIASQWLDENKTASEIQRKEMFEAWFLIDCQLVSVLFGDL